MDLKGISHHFILSYKCHLPLLGSLPSILSPPISNPFFLPPPFDPPSPPIFYWSHGYYDHRFHHPPPPLPSSNSDTSSR